MTCRWIRRADLLGRYIKGDLSPAEADAVERHCLRCGSCFASLQQEERIAAFFREGLAQPLLSPDPVVRRGSITLRRMAWRGAVLIAAAASVFLIVYLRSEHGADRLQKLAACEPPVYHALSTRGQVAQDQFAEHFLRGMEHYQQSAYRAAVPDLRQALNMQPRNNMARFFLGATLLFADEPRQALIELAPLLRQSDNPYIEDAHWYSGKACLRLGDIPGARRHFEAVARLGTQHAVPARRILEALP